MHGIGQSEHGVYCVLCLVFFLVLFNLVAVAVDVGLPGLAAVHLAEMENELADLQFCNDWDANPAAAAPSPWQELISAAEPLGVSPGLGMADFPFRSTVSEDDQPELIIYVARPQSI